MLVNVDLDVSSRGMVGSGHGYNNSTPSKGGDGPDSTEILRSILCIAAPPVPVSAFLRPETARNGTSLRAWVEGLGLSV